MNEIVPAAAHDMSFLGLFLQADPIVKGVMILLVLASLGCWTIIFEKLLRIRNIRRQARAFEAAARSGEKLHPQMGGATGRIVAAGHEAWRDQDASESRAERRERIERAMRGGSLRRHAPASGRPAVSRHHGIGCALHRPVRHGLGHHEFVLGDRRAARRRAWRSSRPASPRRCSRPPSASSPRSRR